jgi:hypothetical protein
MEYLLHDPSTNTYKLYHSLRRLCKETGIDHKKLTEDMLPAKTPRGLIIALDPDTRI